MNRDPNPSPIWDWLRHVNEALCKCEADRMVAATKVAMHMHKLEEMYSHGVSPYSAAWALTEEKW